MDTTKIDSCLGEASTPLATERSIGGGALGDSRSTVASASPSDDEFASSGKTSSETASLTSETVATLSSPGMAMMITSPLPTNAHKAAAFTPSSATALVVASKQSPAEDSEGETTGLTSSTGGSNSVTSSLENLTSPAEITSDGTLKWNSVYCKHFLFGRCARRRCRFLHGDAEVVQEQRRLLELATAAAAAAANENNGSGGVTETSREIKYMSTPLKNNNSPGGNRMNRPGKGGGASAAGGGTMLIRREEKLDFSGQPNHHNIGNGRVTYAPQRRGSFGAAPSCKYFNYPPPCNRPDSISTTPMYGNNNDGDRRRIMNHQSRVGGGGGGPNNNMWQNNNSCPSPPPGHYHGSPHRSSNFLYSSDYNDCMSSWTTNVPPPPASDPCSVPSFMRSSQRGAPNMSMPPPRQPQDLRGTDYQLRLLPGGFNSQPLNGMSSSNTQQFGQEREATISSSLCTNPLRTERPNLASASAAAASAAAQAAEQLAAQGRGQSVQSGNRQAKTATITSDIRFVQAAESLSERYNMPFVSVYLPGQGYVLQFIETGGVTTQSPAAATAPGAQHSSSQMEAKRAPNHPSDSLNGSSAFLPFFSPRPGDHDDQNERGGGSTGSSPLSALAGLLELDFFSRPETRQDPCLATAGMPLGIVEKIPSVLDGNQGSLSSSGELSNGTAAISSSSFGGVTRPVSGSRDSTPARSWLDVLKQPPPTLPKGKKMDMEINGSKSRHEKSLVEEDPWPELSRQLVGTDEQHLKDAQQSTRNPATKGVGSGGDEEAVLDMQTSSEGFLTKSSRMTARDNVDVFQFLTSEGSQRQQQLQLSSSCHGGFISEKDYHSNDNNLSSADREFFNGDLGEPQSRGTGGLLQQEEPKTLQGQMTAALTQSSSTHPTTSSEAKAFSLGSFAWLSDLGVSTSCTDVSGFEDSTTSFPGRIQANETIASSEEIGGGSTTTTTHTNVNMTSHDPSLNGMTWSVGGGPPTTLTPRMREVGGPSSTNGMMMKSKVITKTLCPSLVVSAFQPCTPRPDDGEVTGEANSSHGHGMSVGSESLRFGESLLGGGSSRRNSRGETSSLGEGGGDVSIEGDHDSTSMSPTAALIASIWHGAGLEEDEEEHHPCEVLITKAKQLDSESNAPTRRCHDTLFGM
ncbi:zinc finger protein [Cystoisospora suis]|uniref:Zinc finger protein n=1 Tax=Cystoisospora suis TaxID=483139 RepID=A0A2C6L8J8_9APIC|nr:zinc finger protein [Cystoisospora suis]